MIHSKINDDELIKSNRLAGLNFLVFISNCIFTSVLSVSPAVKGIWFIMKPSGGWVGKILRVDLTTRKISEVSTLEYVPKFLGGRGLGAKICWDEVPPEVGAFDPENRIIFATGPMQGTLAPTSGRFMVLGKAAQTAPTESFCRSGVGGHWAPELKWAGYDALIVQGKSEKPVYLWITDHKAEILDASRL
jgi:aldehyde:ferredoxin oxidoreductase